MSRRKVLVGAMILSAFGCGLWWLSRPESEGRGGCPQPPEKIESLEVVESVDSVEQIESIEQSESSERRGRSPRPTETAKPSPNQPNLPISYKMPDPAIPRVRQAATANRLFVAPEKGRAVEETFAATQTPSARGTVPYVLVPTTEYDDIHVARLDALGVRRLGYFPPNGILVELTEDQFKAVSDEPIFSLVGEWCAEDKIDPFMARQFDKDGLRLTVVTCNFADRDALAGVVASLGGAVERQGDDGNGWVRVSLPADKDKLVELAAHGEVRWIEPYEQPRAANNCAVKPTDLNVTPVWNMHGLTGTNQIVAVCDSGLDTGVKNTVMQDFQGRILDFIDFGGYGCDDYSGHGTHVAGSFFGNGALSDGVLKGVAYEAKAVVFGVGSDNPDDPFLYFDYAASWEDAFTRGIASYAYRIHSNSWGGDNTGTYNETSVGADAAAVRYSNLLVSIASGNLDEYGNLLTGSPGTAKNALTVGNCDSSRYATYGGPNNRNPSSCYNTIDKRFKPDLMASGTYINSTKSTLRTTTDYTWDVETGKSYYNYTQLTGTSMATPLASGCATLVRQWLVERRNMNEPSSALIKAILTGGANGSRPTHEQGWGRINLENSLFPANGVVYLKDYITLNAKSQCVASFTITNSAPMKVQLAWIDPVASQGASLTLVNNHNLVVSNATTGTFWYGNDFDGAKRWDTVNNIEGVRIDSTTVEHEYRIYITGRTAQAQGTSVPALYVVAAARENEVTDAEESDGAADEFGVVPYHWYTFDSDMSSQGVDECLSGGENSYDVYVTNNIAAQSGRALVTLDGKLHPYGTMVSSDAFTLMASLKSVETTNAVLLSIGSVSGNGITLVANGPDKVKLLGRSVTYGQLSTRTREITVEKATTRYHHYALTYRNGSYQLYVDGVAAGEAVGLTQSTRGVQLGGQLGGVGNLGVTRASGVCIDDFRVYTNALDAATVSGYAAHFPPWPGAGEFDEAGIVPAHWYKFDGTTESIGASPCFASGMDGAGFMATQDGQALVTDASVIPTGTMTNSETFAVAFSLKSVTTADAALFSIGDLTSNGIIITANGPNSIRFDLHDGNAAVNPFPIVVQNAASRFHHYVINYYRLANGNYQYKFYVDGVVAKTPNKNNTSQMVDVMFTRNQANRSVKLGGVAGGNGNLGVTTAPDVAIDDFRVYATSLTEDQIASYASHLPVWEPEALPFTANVTGDVTWSTGAGLSNTTGVFSNDGSTAVLLTNTTASATITFDTATSFKDLGIYGTGEVTLAPMAALDLPTLTVGAGLSALALKDTELTGTTLSLSPMTLLRYTGTTTLGSWPYAEQATPEGGVAIARPITTDAIRMGSHSSTRLDQTFVVESGAEISTGRFVVGDGGENGNKSSVTVNHNGGSIVVSGSASATDTGASVFFGHWPSTVRYNLGGGELIASNAVARIGWNGTVEVFIGGEDEPALFHAKGIRAGTERTNDALVTVKTNGVLSLGSGGVQFSGSQATLGLAGGTLRLNSTEDSSTVNSTVTVVRASRVETAAIVNGMPVSGEAVRLFSLSSASSTNLLTVTGLDGVSLRGCALVYENGFAVVKPTGYVYDYGTGDSGVTVTIPTAEAAAWAAKYGTDVATAFGETGANGLDNALNCILGLSPTDEAPPLSCTISIAADGTIAIDALEDFDPIASVSVTLVLEAAATPNPGADGWTAVGEPATLDNPAFVVTKAADAVAKFFRVRVAFSTAE